MPISALVVTLDALSAPQALSALRRLEGLELGHAQGLRIPVVTETASLDAGRDLVQQLQNTPGVVQVDVVSVQFEDTVF